MAKVKVFQFKGWDQQKGEHVVAPFKSTAARIGRLDPPVEIIPGTEEDVDEREIDEEGRYDPSRASSASQDA